MAISFVASAFTDGVSSPVSVTKPPATQTNDVLLAVAQAGATGDTFTPPSGWTQLDKYSDTGSAMTCASFYKLAGSSEPASYSFSATNGGYLNVVIAGFRGCDTTTPIDAHAGQDNSTANGNTIVPSVTPGTGITSDMWVALCANNFSATYASPPAGWTKASGSDDANGDAIFYNQLSSSAATGTATFNLSSGSAQSVGFSILLKAAVTGGSSWNQSLTDTTSSTDVSRRAALKVLTETQAATDALTKLFTSLRRDQTSATDASARTISKPLGETLSATDAVSATRGALISLLDALSSKDPSVSLGTAKVLADATSAVDILTRLYTVLRTDAFSLVDTLAKIPAHTFLEWASQTDSVTATKLAGTAWSRSVTDGTSALDVVARQLTKLTTDQVSALDSLTRTWVARLVLLDLFSETDAQQKQLTHSLYDTQVGQDVVQKLAQHLLQEAQSATDARTNLVLHALAETVSSTDAQTRRYSKGLLDALSQTDKVTAGRVLLLTLLEALSLTDSLGQPQLAHPLAAQKIGMVASLVATLVGMQVSLQLGTGVVAVVTLVPSPVSLSVVLL